MKDGKYLQVILLIIALLHTQNIFAWWHTEVLDKNFPKDPPGGFSKSAIAIGDNSIIHITYVDLVERNLVYSYNDKKIWYTEIVDHNVGNLDPSITLDSNNNPHINYGNKYAHRDFKWNVEIVTDAVYNSLLALDSHDNPHIISLYSFSGPLTYSYKDNSGWITEILEFDGRMPSTIAFDTKDNPHVSYASSSPDHALKYAYRDSTGWHIETADGNFDDSRFQVVFALDVSGTPHICYNPISQQEYVLKHAHKDSTGWHIEILEEEKVDSLSMAWSTNDRPHICYLSLDNDDVGVLKYAYKDITTWHTEVINNSFRDVDADKAGSLILDSNNTPHVTYYSRWGYSVNFGLLIFGYGGGFSKYAYKVGPQWQMNLIDEGYVLQEGLMIINIGVANLFTIKAELDYEASMALDGMGNPHIFFVDGWTVNVGAGLKIFTVEEM